MSSVSSIVPPTFLTVLTFLRSTVDVLRSDTRLTASTAMGDRMEEYCETILELREVLAARRSESRSLRSTGVAISSRYSTHFAAAREKLSAMIVGWMPVRVPLLRHDALNEGVDAPLASIFSAAPSRLPANTTTLVVPSPAATSCAADSSTSILAAGWRTLMCLRMVAPSFEMVTLPSACWIILSIPRGPSEDRMASDRAFAAVRLLPDWRRERRFFRE